MGLFIPEPLEGNSFKMYGLKRYGLNRFGLETGAKKGGA